MLWYTCVLYTSFFLPFFPNPKLRFKSSCHVSVSLLGWYQLYSFPSLIEDNPLQPRMWTHLAGQRSVWGEMCLAFSERVWALTTKKALKKKVMHTFLKGHKWDTTALRSKYMYVCMYEQLHRISPSLPWVMQYECISNALSKIVISDRGGFKDTVYLSHKDASWR